MKKIKILLLLTLLVGLGAKESSGVSPQNFSLLEKFPLYFESHSDQNNPKIKFLTRGKGYGMYFTQEGMILSLHSSKDNRFENLKMSFVGGNPRALLQGVETLLGKSHYFRGKEKSAWQTNVPHFAKVQYEQLYSGIDLIFYGNPKQLEYDVVVNPGADLSQVEFAFQGAKEMKLDEQGDLILTMAEGKKIIQKAPIIYQEQAGNKKPVAGKFILKEKNHVAFQVAQYDSSQKLIIDPSLEFSTYLGGSGDESFYTHVAVDPQGNIYLTGGTNSLDFPTLNPIPNGQAFHGNAIGGGEDVFVTKMNANYQIVYSTYLGGSDFEDQEAIAVDPQGNAYITGYTRSSNFPVSNPFPNGGALQGTRDAFVTKLNASGQLVYSTYLGGSNLDSGKDVTLDPQGNVYVIGSTSGGTHGGSDVFVTKINSNAQVVYSAYLGGTGNDYGEGIRADASQNMFLTGYTESADFPTLNFLPNGGDTLKGRRDIFVTKLDANGQLLYSTYLGGTDDEQYSRIALDPQGNMCLIGDTESTNFPTTPNPFPNGRSLQGHRDAFVTKLNPNGQMVYSAYLGGSGNDSGAEIAVDPLGNMYLTGNTRSPNFPVSNSLPNGGALRGPRDGFVTKLNANGQLMYSTYLGGSGYDDGEGIAVDSQENAYVSGKTYSSDFYVVNPLSNGNALRGNSDAFVVKIASACSGVPAALPLRSCQRWACNSQTRQFQLVNLSRGTSCADNDLCNGLETCNGSGACLAGRPLRVDDGNPCTRDKCDPQAGRINSPLPDGKKCSGKDPLRSRCYYGVCAAGSCDIKDWGRCF